MKLLKVLLVGGLCFGLIWGLSLIGCGDDNEESCKDTCQKVEECFGFDKDDCITGCEIYDTDQMDCILDCDTDADCFPDYSNCLNDCGGFPSL